MENQNDINSKALDFDFKETEENHSIIKVVGVGGGGSNAVQHMYEAGIQDVSFLIINTDRQALKGSSIPKKLLISEKGLGAGAKPEVAREFAMQYSDAIRQALSDGTEMVFITAGMGGGTGTGAAPVVAEIAHEMGILTVGIVTIPFRFEGKKKIIMALEGVRAIEKWCDALLVVNNNRLIDIYPDLNFGNAFGKADDTLTTAAKSISDIINVKGYINLDFADVSTTLRNGGVALISTGIAQGEGRLSKAIEAATNSPLLQDNKITDAKHLLFELCFSPENPLSMSEVAEMNDFVGKLNTEIEVIWGAMYDDTLGDDVKIILLASGFAMDHTTGTVFADTRMGDRIKELQGVMRQAIADRQNLVGDFDGYPEAADILVQALRVAREKADNFSIDDSVDDEVAKLDIAYSKAQDKMQEVKNAELKRKLQEEKEQQDREILAKIEELKKHLSKPVSAVDPIETVSVVKAPEAQSAAEPKGVQGQLELFPIEDGPQASEAPKQTEAPKTAETSTPIVVTPPTPQPASNPHSGIEEIRRYYGEEAAGKYLLDDIRKTYFILDDQDLTNEQLIERLEHLPAYDRTLEDLGQLRVESRRPASPKVIGKHDVSSSNN